MKHQFLPYQFKYIGLILFLLTGACANIQDFVNGFIGAHTGNPKSAIDFGFHDIFYSKTFLLLQYLGILMYALSKDKVFDELMLRIRHESMYLVFFSTISFILVGLFININWQISAAHLIEAQMMLFLIVNTIRKRFIFA